jgi:hypothetical protein
LKGKIESWTDSESLSEIACVYTTGSFGRSDASVFSDLDVFVISNVEEMFEQRALSNLQQTELLASIISTNREMKLPELDADGNFLRAHTKNDYLVGLGKPDDDKNNTFTGRLLLLLESQPLFGDNLYYNIKEECILRYWTDYSDHADSFLPAFLLNDILRFWRTLCINYESGFERGKLIDPAKRRAKNYKLKYSRVLTCFATVIGLQSQLVKYGSVSPDQALELSELFPIDRLSQARDISRKTDTLVTSIVACYNEFLVETNCSKEDLRQKMDDSAYYRDSLVSARSFGDLIFLLMQEIAMSQKSGSKAWQFLRYATV